MDVVGEAVAWVRREPGAALGVGAGLYLVLFCLVVRALAGQARLARRQARLLRGVNGADLEETLLVQGGLLEQIGERVADTVSLGRENEALLRRCLQRVGVVRYDAFPNVGGGQSFSVALLDGEGNGVVLSGLHSRHDLRVYAKPVLAGASPVALTEEEQDAIRRSRAGGTEGGARATADAGGGSGGR